MKKIIKLIIWLLFFATVSINIHLFVKSIAMGDEITKMDKETRALHKENMVLETKLYEVDSFRYAASVSAQMAFTKQSQPIKLDDIKYAYR